MLMRYSGGDSGVLGRALCVYVCACVFVRMHTFVCVCVYLFMIRPINHGSDSSLISCLQLTLWSQEFQPLDMIVTKGQIK